MENLSTCDDHCQCQSVSSTNATLTVVVQVTIDADRADLVGAQIAQAIRSVAALGNARLTVRDRGTGGAEASFAPPTRLKLEPRVRIIAAERRVLRDGQEVPLTRLEYDLLLFLCRNPGRVHDRDALMAAVWKLSAPYRSRTIDVHVRRLRRKLGDDLELIDTVRGVGYRVPDAGLVRIEEHETVQRSA